MIEKCRGCIYYRKDFLLFWTDVYARCNHPENRWSFVTTVRAKPDECQQGKWKTTKHPEQKPEFDFETRIVKVEMWRQSND